MQPPIARDARAAEAGRFAELRDAVVRLAQGHTPSCAGGDDAELAAALRKISWKISSAPTTLGDRGFPNSATGSDVPEDADQAARAALAQDLRDALPTDDLFLAYQPKLNVRSGQIDAVEALARWRHPVRGLVPPDEFVSLAEETGDIGQVTERVLEIAIRDQRCLAACGLRPAMHVNLSGRLIADEAFCAWVRERCAGAEGRIGLEITETAVIADPERALRNLKAFAEAGIDIAIDDYGSGLSSLAYMKALPANELKIDKAFVQGLSSSHRDPLIVRSTIDLAHALQMQVTAEGVDDPTAFALLRVMGCDRIQGYLIAPPLELAALQNFLLEHQAGRAAPQAGGALLSLRRGRS